MVSCFPRNSATPQAGEGSSACTPILPHFPALRRQYRLGVVVKCNLCGLFAQEWDGIFGWRIFFLIHRLPTTLCRELSKFGRRKKKNPQNKKLPNVWGHILASAGEWKEVRLEKEMERGREWKQKEKEDEDNNEQRLTSEHFLLCRPAT